MQKPLERAAFMLKNKKRKIFDFPIEILVNI